MAQISQLQDKRAGVEDIYETLQEEILSMQLRPGDKLSEADVAARFGVSRQPVRDAFSRLANLDLLVIRPKRATEVKRFSTREIQKSRFVRTAVEEKVLRLASQHCDLIGAARLDMALTEQAEAVANADVEGFGVLDFTFHKLLCTVAKADFAFDVIQAEKTKVDRLCRLSLAKEDHMPELIADHRDIAEAVKSNDMERAVAAGLRHLGRLDVTINNIAESHADYFDQD